MKARIVRYGFIGVVAVLIILCGMKFSNISTFIYPEIFLRECGTVE